MSLLSYVLLKHIQSIFQINKTRFFEWYKYNNQEQEILLNHLYEELLDLDLSTNDTWKNRKLTGIAFENKSTKNQFKYINTPDIAVRFKDRYNRNTDTILWPIDNTNNEIYVSYNEALTFMKNRLIKFNLIRAKYGFSVHYINKNTNKSDAISIGGELIDVSIGHKDDIFVNKFYYSVDKYISLYELNINDTRIFRFRSFSIIYLFKDLYRMLFIDVSYPWDEQKYVKRINRLFYIGYIDLFTKFPNNKERLQYLNTLLEVLLEIEKVLIQENTTLQQNNNVRESIRKLKDKIKNSELIYDLLLEQLLVVLLYKNKPSKSINTDSLYDIRDVHAPYNVDKSVESSTINESYVMTTSSNKTIYEHKMEFIEVCKQNLEILLLSFKNIELYCYNYAFNEETLYEK